MTILESIILDHVNSHTNRERMDTVSTGDIEKTFELSNGRVYQILKSLSNQGLILHLDPVNGKNFQMCDWCRISD